MVFFRHIFYPYAYKKRKHNGTPSTEFYHQEVTITTADNIELSCFLVASRRQVSKGTVVAFHGSAMNRAGACGHAENFLDCGFTVLVAEYRGYGPKDPGHIPTEKGLQLDAQAALDYVTSDPVLSLLPIVIFGHSVGGAVAIDVASKNVSKISALIVENTFTSVADFMRWRLPPLGLIGSIIWHRKWCSKSKIAKMPASLPMLFLSSAGDSVVPQRIMKDLCKAARMREASNTQDDRLVLSWKSIEYGDHSDPHTKREYHDSLARFLLHIRPNNLAT